MVIEILGRLGIPFRHLLFLLFLRLLYATFTLTYAVPDEYWQGPEVAHRLVFGRGFLTWEWDSSVALRSYLHPLLISLGYLPFALLEWCSGMLSVPTRLWFINWVYFPIFWAVPRIMATIFSLCTDAGLYSLTLRSFGEGAAWWATVLYATSWNSVFYSARPLSNGVETTLTMWALNIWCLHGKGFFAGALAGLAFLVRPTSAVTWICLGGLALFSRDRFRQDGLLVVSYRESSIYRAFVSAFPSAFSAVMAVTVLLDWPMYGRATFPALNFLNFNALQGKASLYGVHSISWYFTSSLPLIFGLYTPFLLHGLRFGCTGLSQSMMVSSGDTPTTHNKSRGAALQKLPKMPPISPGAAVPALVALGSIIILSFTPHKEDRYISPYIPLLYPYVGYSVATVLDSSTKNTPEPLRRTLLKAILASFCTTVNLLLGFYLNVFHQRGAMGVVKALGRIAALAALSPTPPSLVTVHFLLPCHATPFHSILHFHATLRHFDCSPMAREELQLAATGGKGEREGGVVHTTHGPPPKPDVFAAKEHHWWASDGRGFLRGMYETFEGNKSRTPLPTHFVVFDREVDPSGVADWLAAFNYTLLEAFPYAEFQGDSHDPRPPPRNILLYQHDAIA